ncbi:MAG: DUF4670 domain-containing protein [Clostridiales bacterium]|nr:DUF4670 domain-containing protein [Clostridiales bacterium]
MADDIRSLQRKLERAEKEMARLTREMQTQRERMRREQQREMETQQREMEKAIQSRERDAEEKYRRLLREYQASLEGTLSENMHRMQAEYEALKSRLEEATKNWEERSEELSRFVREEKERKQEKDEKERWEAEEQLETLEEKLHKVAELPTERFRAGRLGIVRDMTATAAQFLKKGFCQSALGMAISALSDAKRLELEIQEGMQEWLMEVHQWESVQEAAVRLLEQEAAHAEGFLDGPVEISEEERKSHDWKSDMNYWSHGELKEAETELHLHGAQIRGIREQIPEEYLKKDGSLSTYEVRARRKELEKVVSRLEGAIQYYQNAWNAYVDRMRLGESVIDYLQGQEFRFLSFGFTVRRKEELDEAWESWLASYPLESLEEEEDYRDIYCICFTDSDGALLAVSILPERADSEVSNRLQYYIELGRSLGGDRYENGLLAVVRKAGREAMRDPALTAGVTEDPERIQEETMVTAGDGFLPRPEDREKRKIVDMVHHMSNK